MSAGLPAVPLLALRRRFPVQVCAALAGHAAAICLLVGSRPLIGLLVALYTVARLRGPRAVVACLPLVVAAQAAMVTYDVVTIPSPGYLVLAVVVVHALLDAVALVAGRARRASAGEVQALRDTRDALAAEAVALERLRIARELHDIVAHAVTVMVVQAAGARRALRTDPVAAEESMAAVEELGREAVSEMRRLLTVLRSVSAVEGAGPADGPDPRLASLAELTTSIEATGLRVSVTREGPEGRLDPSVDLTAYRVLQEALTNVTRHAGPGTGVDVRLTWDAELLTVEVEDDGAGQRLDDLHLLSSGLGLAGLRERVTLIGGTLAGGPRDGGGYRLTASLPVQAAAPERAVR